MDYNKCHDLLKELVILGLYHPPIDGHPSPVYHLVKHAISQDSTFWIDITCKMSYLSASTKNTITIPLSGTLSNDLYLKIEYDHSLQKYHWSWADCDNVYAEFITQANKILNQTLKRRV